MSKVIPSYASDYPKEFLLMKGIEKCLGELKKLTPTPRTTH